MSLDDLAGNIWDVCEQHAAADLGNTRGGDPPDVPIFCTNWDECRAELKRLIQEWQAKNRLTSVGISNSPILDLPLIDFRVVEGRI